MNTDNIAAVFADEVRMRNLVASIEKIEKTMSVLAERLVGMERAVPNIIGAATSGTADLNAALDDTTDRMQEALDLAEEGFSSWEKWGQKLTGLFQGVGSAIGTVADQAQRVGLRLQSNAHAEVFNAVGQLPYVGPLMQMAFNAKFREDKLETAGRQSVLKFAGNEQLRPAEVRETGAAIGQNMKSLEENFLAKREEVQAVWGAFAEGGLKSKDVLQQAGYEIKGFGSSVAQVALGIDKAFGLTAGSSAQLSNQLRQDTNVGITESVRLVKDLGLASHGTGQNMQAFIGTILQTTSALRVQGGDARDLANTYFRLQETIKASMDSRASSTRISALTSTALGGLSQFAQSMPQGLKALVGQDMAREMGLNLSDIGSLRAMQTGFQFAGRDQGKSGLSEQDFSKKVAETAYSRLKAEGVRPGDDMFMALTSMGMPALLAEVLNRAQGKLTGKGADSAAAEFEAKMKQVGDLQPLNVGAFEKAMDDIQNLMMSIGLMTIATLNLIVQAIIGAARVSFGDGRYTKGDFEKDVFGAAGKLGAEASHFGALSKRLLGDSFGKDGIINVGDYFRPGSGTKLSAMGVPNLDITAGMDKFMASHFQPHKNALGFADDPGSVYKTSRALGKGVESSLDSAQARASADEVREIRDFIESQNSAFVIETVQRLTRVKPRQKRFEVPHGTAPQQE